MNEWKVQQKRKDGIRWVNKHEQTCTTPWTDFSFFLFKKSVRVFQYMQQPLPLIRFVSLVPSVQKSWYFHSLCGSNASSRHFRWSSFFSWFICFIDIRTQFASVTPRIFYPLALSSCFWKSKTGASGDKPRFIWKNSNQERKEADIQIHAPRTYPTRHSFLLFNSFHLDRPILLFQKERPEKGLPTYLSQYSPRPHKRTMPHCRILLLKNGARLTVMHLTVFLF